jgi:acyl carrier protein
MSVNLHDRVREVVATTFGVNPRVVTESTRQEDLKSWDSLGHVNLMVAIEGAFDVVLEPEDLSVLTSVPAIVTYLEANGTFT